jgi:hypothetical protein
MRSPRKICNKVEPIITMQAYEDLGYKKADSMKRGDY